MDDYYLTPDGAMTDDELDHWWKLLIAKIRLARTEDPKANALDQMMKEAAGGGDAGFAQLFAWQISEKMLRQEELTPHEQFFAVWALHTISCDDVAAKRIASIRRDSAGRPRHGTKGLAVAISVIDAIKAEGAKSVEDAISKAAEACAIGEDMAKKHWMTWREVALALDEITRADLRRAIVANKNTGK